MKPVITASKDARRRIVGYYAEYGDVKEFGHTKEEALHRCESTVLVLCERRSTNRIYTFGRFTLIVNITAGQRKQFEYTILDATMHRKYGQHFTCCCFQSDDFQSAVSTACSALAQRVHSDAPDTELLAAILSYVNVKDLAEFNHWREVMARYTLELETK